MWYFGNSYDGISEHIKTFFERRVPGLFISGHFSYTAKIRENQILAAAIYRNYNGSNVDIHLQAEGHFDRACLRAVFTFPFVVTKCNRLTAPIEEHNKRMISIVERLGFEREGTLKNYYGLDKHCVLYRMDKHKAEKWIG